MRLLLGRPPAAENATTTCTYNNADEMTAAGGVTYTYDANGNQTGRGTDTFTFDHEDRMTQSVVGGVTSSSVYYGNGVRRSHTVNGATTAYAYDVLASLPVVIQDGTYSYVYGLDLISMTGGTRGWAPIVPATPCPHHAAVSSQALGTSVESRRRESVDVSHELH